jgi:glucose-6-phosphate 1-epimerase
MELEKLNKMYTGVGNVLFKEGKGGLHSVHIVNQFASSEISLYGAHILSFKPTKGKELLWLSENSFFTEGKPIRGGIPLCFPWFGPNTSDNTLPPHGFARIMYWGVEEILDLPDNSTRLILKCESNESTRKIWPFEFNAKLIIIIGEKLDITLQVINSDTREFKYTDALHTYFLISDTANVTLGGLENSSFRAGFQDDLLQQTDKLLSISKEENRRYIGHTANCVIYDNGFNRKITVAKRGSKTTVVWNPWIETSKSFTDMTLDGYKTMVCVEAVNAYDDFVLLQPGESFNLSAELSVDNL